MVEDAAFSMRSGGAKEQQWLSGDGHRREEEIENGRERQKCKSNAVLQQRMCLLLEQFGFSARISMHLDFPEGFVDEPSAGDSNVLAVYSRFYGKYLQAHTLAR